MNWRLTSTCDRKAFKPKKRHVERHRGIRKHHLVRIIPLLSVIQPKFKKKTRKKIKLALSMTT